jgi:hypothetical protein
MTQRNSGAAFASRRNGPGFHPVQSGLRATRRSKIRLVVLRDRSEPLGEMVAVVLGADHFVERHFLRTLVGPVTLNPGKSTLIETMALQDLERGNGFALIDPHGDLVARVAARIPASHRDKVIYLDATDPNQPYGYNPLRHVSEDRIALAASGMMDVFKKGLLPIEWVIFRNFDVIPVFDDDTLADR